VAHHRIGTPPPATFPPPPTLPLPAKLRLAARLPARSVVLTVATAMVSAVAAIGLAPRGAVAQELVGEVLQQDGRAIRDASVGLLDADGELIAFARSSSSGRFEVRAPATGEFTLHVTRLGYRSVTGGPYTLEAGMVLEVLVFMHRAPASLSPIDVEVEPGRSRQLEMRGFYDRQASGHGYFFDRETIENHTSTYLAELLDRLVPRVRMDRRNRLFGSSVVRNPGITFDQGGRFCSPALWVDGMRLRTGTGGPIRLDDWVGPDEAEAVEFYSGPATAPLEFSGGTECAVVVVWTRAGR